MFVVRRLKFSSLLTTKKRSKIIYIIKNIFFYYLPSPPKLIYFTLKFQFCITDQNQESNLSYRNLINEIKINWNNREIVFKLEILSHIWNSKHKFYLLDQLEILSKWILLKLSYLDSFKLRKFIRKNCSTN